MRLWRKTRVPYTHFEICFGADANRNWDFYWDQDGTNNISCSQVYAGPKPFSEPSTAALSQYLAGIADNLVSYLTFHSYSQLLMVPYGNTTDHLDNYNDTVDINVI